MITPLPGWTPLQRAKFGPISHERVREMADLTGLNEEQVRESLDREHSSVQVFINDIYQVTRRVISPSDNPDAPEAVHLNIRRRDGGACHDWRHFQQIKNELIGEECEAVELYPAESRLVDTSNKYHLVGVVDPAWRFPTGGIFGNKRDVNYISGNTPGTRQRPLEVETQHG